MSRILQNALCSSLLLVVSGCGGGSSDLPDLAEVSGTVTLNGTPLANAVVEFQPTADGRPSTGQTDRKGAYTLKYTLEEDGAMIGEHSVVITRLEGETDYESGNEGDDDGDDPGTGLPISASNGSIKRTVEDGSNTIDIDISI